MPIAIQLFQEPAEDNPVNITSYTALLYLSIDNLRCGLEAINQNNFEHIELAKEGSIPKVEPHAFRGTLTRRIMHLYKLQRAQDSM